MDVVKAYELATVDASDTPVRPHQVQRTKWNTADGTEHEAAHVRGCSLNVDELEALGHEALRVAADWRKEIAERAPTPPAYKVFPFIGYYGGDKNIATWIERPWAFVRFGKGTSIAYLVKARETFGGSTFQAWIVSAKKDADGRPCYADGKLRWKHRFEATSTIDQRDLIRVFPYLLPDSPTIGDLEAARAEAHRKGAP